MASRHTDDGSVSRNIYAAINRLARRNKRLEVEALASNFEKDQIGVAYALGQAIANTAIIIELSSLARNGEFGGAEESLMDETIEGKQAKAERTNGHKEPK